MIDDKKSNPFNNFAAFDLFKNFLTGGKSKSKSGDTPPKRKSYKARRYRPTGAAVQGWQSLKNQKSKVSRKGKRGGVLKHRTDFDHLVDETVKFNERYNRDNPHKKRKTSRHKVRKELRRKFMNASV